MPILRPVTIPGAGFQPARVRLWAKTEGHVGELSDGEDWIDAEAWGLQPEDLKKGTDEDNNEAQEDTGRKAKRRRRD